VIDTRRSISPSTASAISKAEPSFTHRLKNRYQLQRLIKEPSFRSKFPPAAAVADREIDFSPGQIGVLQIGDQLNAEVSRMPLKSRIRGSNQIVKRTA